MRFRIKFENLLINNGKFLQIGKFWLKIFEFNVLICLKRRKSGENSANLANKITVF
jgi:hypothetical protein